MKPRILIVSGVVPAPDRGGGCLALQRHFVERSDFEVAVASRWTVAGGPVTQLQLDGNLAGRLMRRLGMARLAENLGYLFAGVVLPRRLLAFAQAWQPDVIFSVVDDVHAPIARRLARHLGVPFAANFQDLFVCSRFLVPWQRPYDWLVPLLLERYRELQRSADAVFHTSPGMRAWFGAEARGEVLFPVGGMTRTPPAVATTLPAGRLSLFYAGNCYGPYGKMLLRLAHRLSVHPRWSLVIYSMGHDWPSEEVVRFTKAGVYRGYRPFTELRTEFAAAAAFLATMSFDPADRDFMATSFTTKLVDYVAWAKPILVWAPEYSSATHFATTTGAALAVTQPDEGAVLAALDRLGQDRSLLEAMASAAARTAANELAADNIHGVLRATLTALASRA